MDKLLGSGAIKRLDTVSEVKGLKSNLTRQKTKDREGLEGEPITGARVEIM